MTAVLVASGVFLYLRVPGLPGSSNTSTSPSSGLVPILWESTTFDLSNGETPVQAAAAFHANFLFRGTFQWGLGGAQVGPESSSPLFAHLSQSIRALKHSDPGLIYEGGYGTQYLPTNATWPNGTAVAPPSLAGMIAKNSTGGLMTGYTGYVPDLASQEYRTYVVQWSERQVDEGVDGIFYDDPYQYASYLVNVENQNATVVYNAYAGYMDSVVKAVQSYASAQGRSFFATINSGTCDEIQDQLDYPATINFVSYVSCSADAADFNATSNPSFQPVENFTQLRAAITAMVDVPIMVFIDWPTQQFALGNLTTSQQDTVLTNLYHSVESSGMAFVFEVFHHSPRYDSVAEGTYSTSLRLAAGGTAQASVWFAPLVAACFTLPAASVLFWRRGRSSPEAALYSRNHH